VAMLLAIKSSFLVEGNKHGYFYTLIGNNRFTELLSIRPLHFQSMSYIVNNSKSYLLPTSFYSDHNNTSVCIVKGFSINVGVVYK
jgi:hypothetical protein